MPEEVGDCFEVAGRAAMVAWALTSDLDEYRVVHGLPVGTGGEIRGLRHWHAWVERYVGDVCLVLDRSNGKDLLVTRGDYYRIGQLDEEHVYRYTFGEAVTLMNEHGHFGPWIEGWEELEEAG